MAKPYTADRPEDIDELARLLLAHHVVEFSAGYYIQMTHRSRIAGYDAYDYDHIHCNVHNHRSHRTSVGYRFSGDPFTNDRTDPANARILALANAVSLRLAEIRTAQGKAVAAEQSQVAVDPDLELELPQ